MAAMAIPQSCKHRPYSHHAAGSGAARRARHRVATLALLLSLGAGAVSAAPRPNAADGPAQTPAFEPYALVDQWPGEPPQLAGIIGDPQGLDVDLDDRVFISDRKAGGVVVMLPDGTFLPPIGAVGTDGPARLVSPGRLAVDQTRKRLYVLDGGTDRVVVYDLDGRYLADWNTAGVGIAVAPDGSVFVADGATNQVKVFDPAGAPVRHRRKPADGSWHRLAVADRSDQSPDVGDGRRQPGARRGLGLLPQAGAEETVRPLLFHLDGA
jgi:hypothetical protein